MNKWWKKLALCLLLLFSLSFMIQPVTSRADFGGFSGDSDFGGSDSDGGSLFSDSDSDLGSFDGLIDVAGVIVIIIIAIVWGGKSKSSSGQPEGAKETPDNQLQPMSAYQNLDAGFDESVFREHLSNVYIQMQSCWQDKNIESIKPYMTDAFYYQCERQLEQLKNRGWTNYIERIAVLEVQPRGYYQESGMDHIVVKMRTRIVDYTLDDKTGNLVSGDKKREKFMTYEWDVCRKSGVVTNQTDGLRSVSCPHCGAPLSINQTAKCEYCDSVINIVNEDWALNNIKGISQKTV